MFYFTVYIVDDANDEEKEKKLQTMLWLIKKNFNAQKNLDFIENNPLNSGARVYFLNNPAVLNEYMRHRKKMRRYVFLCTSNTPRKRTSHGLSKTPNVVCDICNLIKDIQIAKTFRKTKSNNY